MTVASKIQERIFPFRKYTPLNRTSVVTVFFRKVFLLLLSLISTVESSGLKIRLNCLNDKRRFKIKQAENLVLKCGKTSIIQIRDHPK